MYQQVEEYKRQRDQQRPSVPNVEPLPLRWSKDLPRKKYNPGDKDDDDDENYIQIGPPNLALWCQQIENYR